MATELFWVGYLPVIPISCLFPDKVFDRFDQQGGEDDESMHTEQRSTEGWIPLKQHPHCYGNSGQRINKDCLIHPFAAGEQVKVHLTIPLRSRNRRILSNAASMFPFGKAVRCPCAGDPGQDLW
jgi:hypothetical protein